MTDYCTQQDLIDRFGEEEILALSDLDRTGSIDETRVTRAIADATATINGYLAGRYALPLTSIPQMLGLIACDIARYRLMGVRPTDEAKGRHSDALAWLTKVGTGAFSLGLDSENGSPQTTGRAAIRQGSGVFTNGALDGFSGFRE